MESRSRGLGHGGIIFAIGTRRWKPELALEKVEAGAEVRPRPFDRRPDLLGIPLSMTDRDVVQINNHLDAVINRAEPLSQRHKLRSPLEGKGNGRQRVAFVRTTLGRVFFTPWVARQR